MKFPAHFRSLPRAMARLAVIAACAVLSGTLYAHPAWEHLPDTPGPVTMIAPELARDAEFLPDEKDNPVLQAYSEFLAKLKAKNLKVDIKSFTVFPDGVLLNSSATPATVRYILKYKVLGEDYTWTESETDGRKSFALTVPGSGSYQITFPADGWLLFLANRPPAPADDPVLAAPDKQSETGTAKTAAELLKDVPAQAAIACIWPEPGATPEYPLMGELKSITFHVTESVASGSAANGTRTVRAEIAMPAKTPEAALKIQNSCQSTIDGVYAEAAKLGKIPAELVNAFTVARKEAVVTIRIALPPDMAKYFFTTFAEALRGSIRPLDVPNKLK